MSCFLLISFSFSLPPNLLPRVSKKMKTLPSSAAVKGCPCCSLFLQLNWVIVSSLSAEKVHNTDPWRVPVLVKSPFEKPNCDNGGKQWENGHLALLSLCLEVFSKSQKGRLWELDWFWLLLLRVLEFRDPPTGPLYSTWYFPSIWWTCSLYSVNDRERSIRIWRNRPLSQTAALWTLLEILCRKK